MTHTTATPLQRLTELYRLCGYGRQAGQLAAQLLADHDTETAAAKGSPRAESTLSSGLLDFLTAIRDALDVPTPALGTPGGYDEMRLLTTRRSAAVHLAATVAVNMGGTTSWGVLTDGIRGGIKRHPVTYPQWQDDEPDGGEQ